MNDGDAGEGPDACVSDQVQERDEVAAGPERDEQDCAEGGAEEIDVEGATGE